LGNLSFILYPIQSPQFLCPQSAVRRAVFLLRFADEIPALTFEVLAYLEQRQDPHRGDSEAAEGVNGSAVPTFGGSQTLPL